MNGNKAIFAGFVKYAGCFLPARRLAPALILPLTLALALALGACGGGGGNNKTDDQSANRPVANAGANQTIAAGTPVTLDGSASSDPNDDTLTFLWSVASGPIGNLAGFDDNTLVNPVFTPDMPGAYVISLVASDGTLNSAPATIAIEVLFNYYVDAVSGSDAADGSKNTPFRTISFAMTYAGVDSWVMVAPGTYDVALGEGFPIVLHQGLKLVGDQPGKGSSTIINAPGGNIFTLSLGNTVAGFTLKNIGTVQYVSAGNLNFLNNTVNQGGPGLFVNDPVGGHLIKGNIFTGLSGVALPITVSPATVSRVEDNSFTGNYYGVEMDTLGLDLGGGPAGSTGGNIFSCNTDNDFWTNRPDTDTIYMQNNQWDHNPPADNDIYNQNAATILTDGATLAPSPCP
ncbi:MAG: DUF1565 domain-containing protein [Deltaproteobacteria bacterium]|nr:DUF1565 domain-containing protein [Deltaproteobacteria bacterium]